MSSKIKCTQEPVLEKATEHEETTTTQVGPQQLKDQRLFQCGLCHVSFERSAELISHVYEHSLIKPFQCGCCQVSFDSSHDLDVHVKSHQQLLPVQASASNSNADSEFSALPVKKPLPDAQDSKEKRDDVSSRSGAIFCQKLRSATKISAKRKENRAIQGKKDGDYVREEILNQTSKKSAISDEELEQVEDASEHEDDGLFSFAIAMGDEQSQCVTVSDFETESRKQGSSITMQSSQNTEAAAPCDKDRTFSCEICGAGFKVARYVGDHKRIVHKVYINKTKNRTSTRNKDAVSFDSENSVIEETMSSAKISQEEGSKIKTISKHTSFNASAEKRVTRSTNSHSMLRSKDTSKSTSDQKKEGPFECLTCRKLLKTERNLKNHAMAVHSGERPFPCSLCPSRFKTKGHMSDHVASVHEGKRPFPCPHCPSEFKSKHWLSIHIEKRHSSHSTDGKFPGNSINYKEKESFPNNMKSGGPFKCLVCGKILSSERTLKTHTITVHSNERPFPCSICSSRFKTKAHMSIHVASVHQGHRPFTCSHCPSQFKSKRWLSMHIARRHPAEAPLDNTYPILCHICGRSCNSAANMKRHLQTHSKDRPFKCNICDAAYRLEKLLHIHMRKHTGEKPYTCEFCGESFARHNNFTYHRNRHLDTRPLRCDLCHKGFNSHPALWQHKRRHLGDKRYSCKQCERKFYNLWSLKRHEVTHTDLRPLSCSKCGKTYRSYSSLKFHRKRHHAEVMHTYLFD